MLEQRVGIVGRWITATIGVSWSVGSIFVIPMIVRADRRARPLQLLRSSAFLMTKTWGESLMAYVGLAILSSLLFGIALGLAVFVAPLLGTLVGAASWTIPIVQLLGFCGVIPIYYLLLVASQVYRGALFIYATEGVVPGPFSLEDMNSGWKLKSGRRSL
jgi:hypothetical protein